MKLKENGAIKKSIEWIRNNPNTEEIISISDVSVCDETKRYSVSEIQGNYPVDVNFTGMQTVTVVYRNKNFGVMTDVIVAGFDALRYTYSYESAYNGEYLSRASLIRVEFVGEYSETIELEGIENEKI